MSENLNPIVLEVEEVRVVNAVSPTVDLSRTENGALVSIHDYRGTQTVVIHDGETGPMGPEGPNAEAARIAAEAARDLAETYAVRAETAADTSTNTHGIFWMEMDEYENVWYYCVGNPGITFMIEDDEEVLYAYVQ